MPDSFTRPQSEIIFVLGGAHSGRSVFAAKLAEERAREDVLFLATAKESDGEMRAHTAEPRVQRPADWLTLEAPRELVEAIRCCEMMPRLIVVDNLAHWVSNVILANEPNMERRLLWQLDILCEWVRLQDIDLILVSEDAELAKVTESAPAQTFRELLGRVNMRAAEHAHVVYWMVAGLPVTVKGKTESQENGPGKKYS